MKIMSNTIRIYNRKNLKKTPRYNIDDPTITGDIKEMIEKKLVIPHQVGMPLTHRSYICMGNCSSCKDHSLDQKRQRKIRAREFARVYQEEVDYE